MGQVGYESDLWLIYIILIVSSSLYYGPVGSLLFTTLWTGLFVGVSLGFYEPGTYFREQMPLRLRLLPDDGLYLHLSGSRAAQAA